MTVLQAEGRIANALVSRAVEASELRIRVIGLESLVRMIGEITKEPEVLKLVALAYLPPGREFPTASDASDVAKV